MTPAEIPFTVYFEARCRHCPWSYGEALEVGADTNVVALMAVQHAIALHGSAFPTCPDCERTGGHDGLCGLNPKAVRV